MFSNFDSQEVLPYVSYVAECPRCSTVNVITRTGAASESVEDPFVCRHCGWYEDLFIEEYMGLNHGDGEEI